MLVVALAVSLYFYWQPSQGNSSGKTADSNPSAAIQNMALEAQFKGPLKDTIIQRWQDPNTGTVCYVYLPVIVQHSPPTPTGYVQYGANGIGSISCLPKP